MDRCLPGSSSRQCPGKNTEAGCHFHLHKVTCRDSKSLDPNWTNLKEWGRFVSADRIGCKHQIVLQKGSIFAKLRKPHWRPVPSSPLTLGNVVQVPATPVCPGSAVSGPLPPDLPNQNPRLPGARALHLLDGSSPRRLCLSASQFFKLCSPSPARRSSLTVWKSPSTHTPASPSHRSWPSWSQFTTHSSHWTVTFFQAGTEQPQDLRRRPGYYSLINILMKDYFTRRTNYNPGKQEREAEGKRDPALLPFCAFCSLSEEDTLLQTLIK